MYNILGGNILHTTPINTNTHTTHTHAEETVFGRAEYTLVGTLELQY